MQRREVPAPVELVPVECFLFSFCLSNNRIRHNSKRRMSAATPDSQSHRACLASGSGCSLPGDATTPALIVDAPLSSITNGVGCILSAHQS